MRTNQRILSLRKKRSAADLTFDIINTAVMLGLIVVTFYPTALKGENFSHKNY